MSHTVCCYGGQASFCNYCREQGTREIQPLHSEAKITIKICEAGVGSVMDDDWSVECEKYLCLEKETPAWLISEDTFRKEYIDEP